MSYRIGSFNCLKFGRSSDKDVRFFADLIRKEKFDIIALQEIRGQKALDRILNCLNLGGKKWDGRADDDPRVNDYAFIWNAGRVELVKTKEIQYERVFEPRIYKQYRVDRRRGETDLKREPYYARFVPIHYAAPFIEIRIINTHIRFSKGEMNGEREEVKELSASKLRCKEYEILAKAIYSKEEDKRYGNNRTSYTILLGDYNLNLECSEAGVPYVEEYIEIKENGIIIKRIKTIQEELTTIKRDTEEDEEKFSSNYDHFSYNEDYFRKVHVISEKIDVVTKYYKDDYEEYKKMVSDHVPIVVKMNLRER